MSRPNIVLHKHYNYGFKLQKAYPVRLQFKFKVADFTRD